jgi:hypothetical protein
MSGHGYLLLPMDPRGSSWDRGAFWDLGGGAALAFVADAPEQADPSTGKWIQQLLEGETAELAARLRGAPPEEASLVAADLMTRIGDHLLERGGGAAYAACALALVAEGAAHFVVVGDCAAYLLPEGAAEARRLSDSTRVAGRSFVQPGAAGRASHYAEAVYVGAAARRFRQSDVIRLPVERDALVALVSDGVEDQLGAGALAERLAAHRDPKALEEALGRELAAARLVDDVTLVAFRAAGRPRGAETAELRERVEELAGVAAAAGRLERELERLRGTVEALPGRLEGQGTDLRELRRRIADLADELVAFERRLGRRAGERSLRDLEARLLALEERQDALTAARGREPVGVRDEPDAAPASASAARRGTPAATPTPRKPWGAATARGASRGAAGRRLAALGAFLGEVLVRRHRRGLAAFAALLGLALLVGAAFLVSERGRAWLGGLGEEPEVPATGAGAVAPAAAAPGAAAPGEAGPAAGAVLLVYTPPAAGSAAGAAPRRVADAAELARLVEAGPPAEPLAIPLELARPFWDRLALWRWRPYAVRPGDSWTRIAERFVVPEEGLRRANARIERRGVAIANPGDALRAGDDVLRVPGFHVRVPAVPADGTTWQALAARLGIEPGSVRPSWIGAGSAGEVRLPLPGDELPPP